MSRGSQDRNAQPRQKGRPRVSERRSSVSTWLPAGAHDRLIALAKAEERSISSLVRHFVVLQLRENN